MQIERFGLAAWIGAPVRRRLRLATTASLMATMLAALAACGGGGDADAVAARETATGYATLDAAGGEVIAADGVRVRVPAGALSGPTTLRIAKDASGAPPLPPELVPAGDMLALTPHGTLFGRERAELSMPAPPVPLQPNQTLKLARAQPGGAWEVLLDSELSNGALVASLDGFSYYRPVVVTYALPLLEVPPFSMTVSLTCGAQNCADAHGPVDYSFTVAGNGGAIPSDCQATTVGIYEEYDGASRRRVVDRPLQGGTAGGRVAPPLSFASTQRVRVGAALVCDSGLSYRYMAARAVEWRAVPASSYAITSTLSCGGHDCGAVAAASVGIDFSYVGNGVVPTNCPNPRVHIEHGPGGAVLWNEIGERSGSIASGGLVSNVQPLGLQYPDYHLHATLRCDGVFTSFLAHRRIAFLRPAAPTVTPPRPTLVLAGQTASFSSVVTGAPLPSIRWQMRPANSTGVWTDVGDGQGATTASFTTPVLGLANNGQQYRVVASNTLGTVESAVVTASVGGQPIAPTITTQPAALNVSAGNEALFVIAATGTEAMSYQWLFNGAAIPGANATTLRLNAVDASRQGNYSVRVGNANGEATSQPALLTVAPGTPAALAPTVVTQPAAVTVHSGDTATFAVGVSGSSPLNFQWRKDGADIAGASAAAYTLTAASGSDAGAYSVVVSNGAGTVTSSSATLSVAPSAAAQAPAISTQPAALVLPPGATATLAVAASGTAPLAYQWARNGTPIAGATGAVLTIAGVTALDAGSYSVSVSNAAGSVASAPATLMLLGAPLISAHPAATTRVEGASADFSVTASGNGVRYQWTRNHVAIAGATGASYTTPALALADSGAVYGVIVYNGAGVVISAGAVLTVSAAVAKAWGSAVLLETLDVGFAQTPQVAVNASGQAVAVWWQSDGVTANIYVNRYTPGAGWGAPQRLSPILAETSGSPRVAIDSDGNAIAVWTMTNAAQGQGSTNLWTSRFTPQAGWGSAALVDGGRDADNLQIAIDGGGNAIVVFDQHEGGRTNVAANRYVRGVGWGTAAAIESDATGSTYKPQVAMDAAGNAMVIWVAWHTSGGPVGYKVWANRYTAGSGWGSAGAISNSASNSDPSPHLALDGAGNAIAIWHWHDGSGSSVWSSRHAAGTGWSAPSLFDTANTNTARYIRVALHASGHGIAVWTQSDGLHDSLMASHYILGQGWGGTVLLETDDAGPASSPRIVFDGDGNATVVWEQRDVATSVSTVWAKRWTQGWGPAVRIDNAPASAASPEIGIDGIGNVIVVGIQSGSWTDIWANVFR